MDPDKPRPVAITATYPDVDLKVEMAANGQWVFFRKDGTPCASE